MELYARGHSTLYVQKVLSRNILDSTNGIYRIRDIE
jgi:hypothetical protein